MTRQDLNGQPVVVLTQEDGSQLFISNAGDPVPLKAVNNGDSKGTLTFADYGKTQTISAPPTEATYSGKSS